MFLFVCFCLHLFDYLHGGGGHECATLVECATTLCLWRSEDNLRDSVLPFHLMSSRDQTLDC